MPVPPFPENYPDQFLVMFGVNEFGRHLIILRIEVAETDLQRVPDEEIPIDEALIVLLY